MGGISTRLIDLQDYTTDLFDVEEIARRTLCHFGDVEIVSQPEEHLETSGA